MIGFLKLFLCFCVYFMVLKTAECQVTITNLNGTGTFLCGHDITLQCAIPGYVDGMSWTLDGILIAQCAFGSCTALNALPSGDIFIPNETAKLFNLIIGITNDDDGKQYKCADGLNQDQTTVNIQVTPSETAFTPVITETTTSITVEAGCFYPPDAGRMDVYCVSDNGTEVLVEVAKNMTNTTTGCSGNCSGPNIIYTATGDITIDSSNTGGTSAYRFKVYHKDFNQTPYTVSIDSSANYTCDKPGCNSKCRIPCLVIEILFSVGTFILVLVFFPFNKGPSSDKNRFIIAGIAVGVCLCVVSGMTACLFAGCDESCAKACQVAGTAVGWPLLVCAAACYIYYLVKSKQLEWLSCGFCQVEPSCETKHPSEPQHCNQPGKGKLARNCDNDKGRENASRTNAGPRPQPVPPTKDPSPLPGITKDKASRGLSATFEDQFDHMPSFESKKGLQPLQNCIPEEDEQKKKKKKKKRKNDETV